MSQSAHLQVVSRRRQWQRLGAHKFSSKAPSQPSLPSFPPHLFDIPTAPDLLAIMAPFGKIFTKEVRAFIPSSHPSHPSQESTWKCDHQFVCCSSRLTVPSSESTAQPPHHGHPRCCEGQWSGPRGHRGRHPQADPRVPEGEPSLEGSRFRRYRWLCPH